MCRCSQRQTEDSLLGSAGWSGTVVLRGCSLLSVKNETFSSRLCSGSSYAELSCPKAIMAFFIFPKTEQLQLQISQDSFPVTGNPQALPLHEGSPLALKYFQQIAFWMAVSAQNSILHFSKRVIDSQNNCRYYSTLPFSSFFHCLNGKNQYWPNNDSLEHHRLFAFSNYKLLFKTQEFMYCWNSRSDNFSVYFTLIYILKDATELYSCFIQNATNSIIFSEIRK